jgi:hypothetical protein
MFAADVSMVCCQQYGINWFTVTRHCRSVSVEPTVQLVAIDIMNLLLTSNASALLDSYLLDS